MQGFQKVVGHQEIITHLQNAISMNKVSHAYLFGGESGSGKKMMASLFAMTLQCEKHGVEPCMECPSCKKAQSQNHPDIIYVKHEKPNTISIDEIREQLINDVMIKPYSSPYKIYIIDEAQKLTLQAQNALLKILEEPPDYGVFLILSTNAERLLPTIRSRCAELQLGPVEQHEALPFLRQSMPDKPDGILRAAYLRAGGFLGQVLTLLQDAEDEPFVRQFAAAYAARDRMALLRILLPMEKAKREQLLPALQQLRACICGALAQRGGLDAASESAAQIVASRSGSELMQASDSIQTAIDALMANASAGAVVGYLTMKLR